MKCIAASVRAKLLNHSRASGTPFGTVLEDYATGRFLWRLSESRFHEQFVLKGSQVFRIWNGNMHRPTRDLDLLKFGDSSPEALAACFAQVCKIETAHDDGLTWGEVDAQPIRKETEYGGVRLTMTPELAGARIHLQIDVGIGDAITPAPTEVAWECLLQFPAARLLAYPPETVVAEKLEAAVSLGINNSRMKDLFDLHWLAGNMGFDLALLSKAVDATFTRRATPFPEGDPFVLTPAFVQDTAKQTQWKAFLRKSKLEPLDLEEVIARLRDFLVPVLRGGHDQASTTLQWQPDAGWVECEKETEE